MKSIKVNCTLHSKYACDFKANVRKDTFRVERLYKTRILLYSNSKFVFAYMYNFFYTARKKETA